MDSLKRILPPGLTTQELIRAVCPDRRQGDVISIGETIQELRARAPGCADTDEAITAAILKFAIGQALAVSFDGRELPTPH